MNTRPRKKRKQRPPSSLVLRRLDLIERRLEMIGRKHDSVTNLQSSMRRKLDLVEAEIHRMRRAEEFRPRQRSWDPDA